MTLIDLSRLRSMFSVSPLRTDTDRPTPSETSATASLAPSDLAVARHVVDEVAELLARIGEVGRRRRASRGGMGTWRKGAGDDSVARRARDAAPRRLPRAAATMITTTSLRLSSLRVRSRRRPSRDPPPPTEAGDGRRRTWLRLQRPSKTRRKEASHELQSLGEALLELSDEHLASLGLGEPLLDAIRAAGASAATRRGAARCS